MVTLFLLVAIYQQVKHGKTRFPAVFIQHSREALNQGRRAVNEKENTMKIKLQFFGEGDPAPVPATEPEPAPERTFTQAEVDTMIGRRIAAAMKGMPGKEELTAFRAWKESQQTEKERWDTLTSERDTARTELTAAQAEIEQYKREKFLLSKGVPAEDVDYYAFKIGKLVTDTTDFEKAAEQYLKDSPPAGIVTVDITAPLGGGRPTQSENDMMNSLIRGARK